MCMVKKDVKLLNVGTQMRFLAKHGDLMGLLVMRDTMQCVIRETYKEGQKMCFLVYKVWQSRWNIRKE